MGRGKRFDEYGDLYEANKREREETDVELFLTMYEMATGQQLKIIRKSECPDFICVRTDGREVGIEITQIMGSPADAGDVFDEFGRILLRKMEKVKKYSTEENILVLVNCE